MSQTAHMHDPHNSLPNCIQSSQASSVQQLCYSHLVHSSNFPESLEAVMSPAIKRDKQSLVSTAILLNFHQAVSWHLSKNWRIVIMNRNGNTSRTSFSMYSKWLRSAYKQTRATSDSSGLAWEVPVHTVSLYCNSSPLRHRGKQDTFQWMLLKHTNGICLNKRCC
jgi:hypothetical protein